MNRKQFIKKRYSTLDGNPNREDRLTALLEGKVIKVVIRKGSVMYYKLDKYKRLTFSKTGHHSSYHPFANGFDYTKVLDDHDYATDSEKSISITKSTTPTNCKNRNLKGDF